MEALKNNMTLSKIYHGGVLRWEKPQSEIEIGYLSPGVEIISGIASPMTSTVKVEIFRGGKMIFENSVDKVFFGFSVSVPKLENRDRVIITVSSPNYKTSRARRSIM